VALEAERQLDARLWAHPALQRRRIVRRICSPDAHAGDHRARPEHLHPGKQHINLNVGNATLKGSIGDTTIVSSTTYQTVHAETNVDQTPVFGYFSVCPPLGIGRPDLGAKTCRSSTRGAGRRSYVCARGPCRHARVRSGLFWTKEDSSNRFRRSIRFRPLRCSRSNRHSIATPCSASTTRILGVRQRDVEHQQAFQVTAACVTRTTSRTTPRIPARIAVADPGASSLRGLAEQGDYLIDAPTSDSGRRGLWRIATATGRAARVRCARRHSRGQVVHSIPNAHEL